MKSLVVILLLVSASIVSSTAFAEKRIVGGSLTPENKFPFIALLWFDDDGDNLAQPFCAGTLIASQWILSAAHCFSDNATSRADSPERLGVSIGIVDITGGVATETISAVFVNPEYNSVTRAGDVALLKLSTDYDGVTIKLPTAASVIPIVGETSVVSGWGRTTEDGSSSTALLDVAVPVRADLICQRVFDGQIDLLGSFCAGGEVEFARDACDGDSGGPLLVQRSGEWVQVGIVNDGIGCARPGIPGVYTRLTHYTDWIVSVVGSDLLLTHFDSTQQEEVRFPRLNVDEPTLGRVLLAQLDIFDITGLSEITLESLNGDVDLHILAGDSFESSSIICNSTNATPLDNCDVPEAGSGRVYAAIFGFEELNNYSISGKANTESGDIDETTPQIIEIGSSGGSSGGGSLWILLHSLFIFFLWRRTSSSS